MFKFNWLLGCCTIVTVTVEVKERRIKLLQMNVEGRGYGLLKVSRHFFVDIEQNPATPLIHFVVLGLIFSGGNSEPNLDGSQDRYSELLIFVVISYVPLLTTNIQTVSNFSLWSVIQNCIFSCYFPLYNNRNPCAEATVYLGFNILL